MIDTKKRIKQHEGFSATIYKDSLGYKTLGYGHLVTIKDDFVIGEVYSPEELEGVFEEDYSIAEKDGLDIIRNQITLEIWETYSDKQKEIVESVLIEMCFNLGKPRVLKFKKFIKALKDKDFKLAEKEMLNSRWAVQVKSRALMLSKMIGEL